MKTLTQKIYASQCSKQHYYNSQKVAATQVSIYRWTNKADVVYIHNQVLAIKKWNLIIYDNMDGSRGYYAKWN